MTKELILYFSRKGNNYSSSGIVNIEQGNTEKIAEYIKDSTGADIFEIVPLHDYPEDYMECTEVAKKEQEENARPELKEYLEDISSYDTIYLGYPNWWGTLPMIVWTQLEKLDFTGKTIRPFVTHEGSGVGTSLNDIKNLCKGATIKKELSIQGSTVDSARERVKTWLTE